MWKQEDMTWEVKRIWRCAKQEYMTLCELKRIWSLVKTRGHDVRSQKDMTLCKPRVYDVVWNQEDTEFWENKRIWREKSKGYDVRNGKDMTLWKTEYMYDVMWTQEDIMFCENKRTWREKSKWYDVVQNKSICMTSCEFKRLWNCVWTHLGLTLCVQAILADL